MSARSIILAEMEDVATEQGRQLAPLADDLVLLDSGLDSLCFANLVARLEDKLGTDPFTASDDVLFPVTVGDFVALYEIGAACHDRSDQDACRQGGSRGAVQTV